MSIKLLATLIFNSQGKGREAKIEGEGKEESTG